MADLIIGVDSAQASDRATLVLSERTYREVPATEHLPTRRESFHVVPLVERLPERATFLQQAERIVEVSEYAQSVADPGATLSVLIETNGPGAPLIEMVMPGLEAKAHRFQVVPITTTSGSDMSRDPKRRGGWLVPKQVLIDNLRLLVEQDRVRLAPTPEAHALQDELKNFERIVTAAGNVTTTARGTTHDDLVMALALALVDPHHRRRGPRATRVSARALAAANAGLNREADWGGGFSG